MTRKRHQFCIKRTFAQQKRFKRVVQETLLHFTHEHVLLRCVVSLHAASIYLPNPAGNPSGTKLHTAGKKKYDRIVSKIIDSRFIQMPARTMSGMVR